MASLFLMKETVKVARQGKCLGREIENKLYIFR
jgi:hypothetical protein